MYMACNAKSLDTAGNQKLMVTSKHNLSAPYPVKSEPYPSLKPHPLTYIINGYVFLCDKIKGHSYIL